jgi:hypothetical protein
VRLLCASLIAISAASQAAVPKPAQLPRTIEARQLGVVTSQSTVAASPGATVSLFVDVSPKPRMHVYAPDQTGAYIRIELTLERDSAFRARKATFPKSSGYFFQPLNETFRVYAQPFRIRQDIVIPNNAAVRRLAAAGKPLEVAGTLRYQACDDEVCYRPQELDVAWTVGLKRPSSK